MTKQISSRDCYGEINVKTFEEPTLTILRWREVDHCKYELMAGDAVYGSLEMFFQPSDPPFSLRTYDFFRGEARTADAQYLFGCTFGNGYFLGHELWNLDYPQPVGKYADHHLNAPWNNRGHIILSNGEIFDWVQGSRPDQRVLARSSSKRLLEFDLFKRQDQGLIKVLDIPFMKHTLSQLLMLFGLYLAVNPCRTRYAA
jgi:hypothetical protein